MTELLNKVREGVKRHRGSLNEISKKSGKHRDTVRRVLKGEFQNLKILEIASTVIEERDKAAFELRQSILKSHERAGQYAPQF